MKTRFHQLHSFPWNLEGGGCLLCSRGPGFSHGLSGCGKAVAADVAAPMASWSLGHNDSGVFLKSVVLGWPSWLWQRKKLPWWANPDSFLEAPRGIFSANPVVDRLQKGPHSLSHPQYPGLLAMRLCHSSRQEMESVFPLVSFGLALQLALTNRMKQGNLVSLLSLYLERTYMHFLFCNPPSSHVTNSRMIHKWLSVLITLSQQLVSSQRQSCLTSSQVTTGKSEPGKTRRTAQLSPTQIDSPQNRELS